MSCSSCKYLKENNKSEGAVSGCCYYCSKIGSYVNGANNECNYFEKSYRSNYLCNKIFEDGEHYYNDFRTSESYLIILFVLLILAIICNI
jgi:hypothetical protein